VGVQRARDHYGTDFDRVVVIGDTPRDADCARANGYACLLVATGPFDASALARCGADAVREDLFDTGAVLDTIARLPYLACAAPGARPPAPDPPRNGRAAL